MLRNCSVRFGSALTFYNQNHYISLSILAQKLLFDFAKLFCQLDSDLTFYNQNHYICLSILNQELFLICEIVLSAWLRFNILQTKSLHFIVHIESKITCWFCEIVLSVWFRFNILQSQSLHSFSILNQKLFSDSAKLLCQFGSDRTFCN